MKQLAASNEVLAAQFNLLAFNQSSLRETENKLRRLKMITPRGG